MEKYDVAVVGGGASGMLCALRLHDRGIKNIVIIEASDRLGKKLSATGNGLGNITNADMGTQHYFCKDYDKVGDIISSFDNFELISYLESLGGLFTIKENGRVYPCSNQASSVTDLLRGEIEKREITVKFSKRCKKLSGAFIIDLGDEKILASQVVLCVGGKAAKQFKTDGTNYTLAQGYGHSVTDLYPSLVQIKTEPAYKQLKGIRADCLVTASHEGKVLSSKRGDVIFTDYGVSGNAIFELSPYITDKENVKITIDFLPRVEEKALEKILSKKTGKSEIFLTILNNQIGRIIEKQGKSAKELAHAAKNFNVTATETLGFDYAQVTRGGIPLDEVDENLMSKKKTGLYFAGEILDVDGECGGYNLQWAFSSAERVAKAIGEKYDG